MAKHKTSLKSTLQKKTPLNAAEKDVASVESEVRSIHRKADKDEVRTTIHLPKDLHTQVKMHCVQNNISIREFITKVIVEKLKLINDEIF